MEATTSTATTPPADKHAHQPRGALDRELYCPRLQRLLDEASVLGHRGNLAQVVASIERGGAGGGGEDPNHGMLRRIGWRDDIDRHGRYIPPSYVVAPLRELEQRWHDLERRHQATALAHYHGTSRAHHTLQAVFGAGQGGLAGVVLYRYQLKQGRARARLAADPRLTAALDAVRAELGPIEGELAGLRNLDRRPRLLDPATRPEDPRPPLVLSRKFIDEARRPYLAALRHWHAQQAVLRFLAAWRLQVADGRAQDLEAAAAPLRAQQAELCAQQATLAAAGDTIDDEQVLVDLCRAGLTDDTKKAYLSGASADVRALHRAWYATARKRSPAHANDLKAFKEQLWG